MKTANVILETGQIEEFHAGGSEPVLGISGAGRPESQAGKDPEKSFPQ